tara:strand:+ start:2286 stop:4328 length:2043 start_codon:yes stop_codon:yes gene_type:complete
VTFTYPSTSSSNETSSSFKGIIDAFNALRESQGETSRYYPPNYQGIIKAIVELQKWGTADTSEYPPGWEIETDGSGNITGGSFNPAPKNGDLWFDERQGRLFVWLDDAYYQANGADGIPTVDATPPTQEVIGALWYNTGNSALYIWNGTTWDQVTAPTGFSTANLMLSTPTTASFTTPGNTLTATTATTQEDFNQWAYAALLELEGVADGSATLATGTTLPGSGTDGELFYKTNNQTLYVYENSNWHPSTPYPDISSDSAITALQTADTGLNTDIEAVEADIASLQTDVGNLQARPAKTYSLGTSATQGAGDGITPGIWLKDNGGVLTGVNINAAGSILVAEGANGITIGAAAIETAIADIEADYLVTADKVELESEITAIEQAVAGFSVTASTLSADVAAIQTALSALPSAADVAERFSASGGTLSGAINMGNHRINGVGAPVENSDAATKKYIDDRETVMRNDLVTKLSNAFTQVKINNTDTALAGIDFSDSAVYGSKAMKFKSAVPTGMGTHYATFGTSDKPYEYSWEYGSNESFNYVHNNTRVFAVADKAYAKDLILCALDANAAGPLYNNPVDVRAKLAELETAKNSMQTTIDNIVIEAGTKNIYYSDTAPNSTLLEDGDIWFDSGNLRLTVRHQGVWVFPDRVEDVALKSALYSAVSTASDFDTLKLKLMAALV